MYDRDRDCFLYYPEWFNNNFTDIAEDDAGNVYFGSYSGFFQYLPDSGTFREYIQYPNASNMSYEYHLIVYQL